MTIGFIYHTHQWLAVVTVVASLAWTLAGLLIVVMQFQA
jgi:hypothetical protein